MFVIKHRTSTKKKKNRGIQFPRDDVNGPSGNCTCIFGPDFADRDRLISFHFPCGAAIAFAFAFHSESELKGLKVNRKEVKDFLLSMLLFLQSMIKVFGIYNFCISS
jgi:hypothetical protein